MQPLKAVSLIVIAFICFFNAINHPFVHDDVVFIAQNPQISRLDDLGSVFLGASNATPTQGINAYYRPILEIVYRLEYRLFGLNAAAYHLVNIIIHMMNGLLLFALLCRLQLSKPLAYVVSLLFLIHPIQSETVACVSGISNLLMAFFVLGGLYCYLREKYVLVFAALIIGLLTKEQAVILPGLIILIDWYRKEKNRWGIWGALGIVMIAVLCLRSSLTGAHIIHDLLQSPTELKLRLLAIPRTILMYLQTIVFPYDLHYYRSTDILASNVWGFAGLGLLMGLIMGLTKRLQSVSQQIMWGAGWFLIALLPILNVIPLINEYSFILTAEHFLYLPMVGVVLIVCVLLREVVSRQLLIVLTILLCLAMGIQTIYQNTFWKGEIALFERTVSFERNFARAHILLARAYYTEGKINLAKAHYSKALGIMKAYERKAANPVAQRFYQGFIKEIYAELAQCELVLKNYNQAIDWLNQALKIDPKDVNLLNTVAVCYLSQGDTFSAEQYLKIALGFDPHYLPARKNLEQLIKGNS